MVVHECHSITRSFLDYSVVQDGAQIVVGASLTGLMEMMMKWNIEKRHLGFACECEHGDDCI